MGAGHAHFHENGGWRSKKGILENPIFGMSDVDDARKQILLLLRNRKFCDYHRSILSSASMAG
jgi:hypothetical protein